MSLSERGFEVFPVDPILEKWVSAALPIARALANDPTHQKSWLRHGRTWFAGVNVFPNSETGRWPGGPDLAGEVIDRARHLCPFDIAWDTAQISIPYRGYPKQDPDESDANHRFRKNRDAAHLDGLLPVGPERKRYMQEYHAFVLGLPLNAAPKDAAPLVVWDGSHKVIRNWLQEELGPYDPKDWGSIDLTSSYAMIRKTIFETCTRTIVNVPPGASYLVDRFALHGVAPWPEMINGPEEGRIIAYFRPHWRGDLRLWLKGS